MKKSFFLFIINFICFSFLGCNNTPKYEKDIESSLATIESNLNSDMDLESLTECISRNSKNIEKAVLDSKLEIFGTSKISDYRRRYESVLKDYYERVGWDISERLDQLNRSCCQFYKGFAYGDCLHYTPEYRVDVLNKMSCGIFDDDRTTYYKLAEELLDIYSVIITNNMCNYRNSNRREYYPSMDRIVKYEREIIAHLEDDRYILNKRYQQYSGDYLKQKEYAEDIEKLTDMINKLKKTSFAWRIGTDFL